MNYFVAGTLLTILAGCGSRSVDFDEEKRKIAFVWTDWTKKTLTGKPDSIAYYFADDALVVSQDPEPFRGKAAMVKLYASAPNNFELDFKWADELKPNLIQFSRDGDMAYSLDLMDAPIIDSAGVKQMQRNKILHIWKKDNAGNWKVALLMACPEK